MQQFFIKVFWLEEDSNLMLDKKVKEMPFKAVLGNLELKMFFVSQPWWGAFNISFVIISIKKFHESCLKS